MSTQTNPISRFFEFFEKPDSDVYKRFIDDVVNETITTDAESALNSGSEAGSSRVCPPTKSSKRISPKSSHDFETALASMTPVLAMV